MTVSYCEWCGSEFIKTTNKVYCTHVCRELATRHYAALQYRREKLLKRQQTPRQCRQCNRPLSMYNESDICLICMQSYDTIKKADILKRMRDDIGD